MHVIVDGIVYARQRYGGINTFFNEVLPRIASQGGVTVDLALPKRLLGTPPGPPVRWLHRDIVPSSTGLSWQLDQWLEPIIETIKVGAVGVRAKAHHHVVFQSTYLTSVLGSIPQVAIVHDMNHELFPELYRDVRGSWLRRRYPEYLRRAMQIIAVSEVTKQHVQQFYGLPPDRIDVIHHGVDPATYFPDTKEQQRDRIARDFAIRLPYILYVGGRWHYKNFQVVLNAAARLFRELGVTVVVAGPPWDERELSEMSHRSYAPALRLVENPDAGLLRVLYSFAAAFVFPSLNEGFGIPLLEAMSCGAPVIASNTSIFHEVAGDAAIYFNPLDPASLVQGVEQCLDAAVCSRYRERGFARAARYSWDQTASGMRAVYEKALGSR